MAFSNRWKFLKTLSSARSSSRKSNSENLNTIVVAVNGDTIGPPDPISNLRPVIFHIPKNESHVERQFRTYREAVQKWNEEFWTIHNERFQKIIKREYQVEKNMYFETSFFFAFTVAFEHSCCIWRESFKEPLERSDFIKRLSSSNDSSAISADEMSIFYKDFLDKHWSTHLKYNKEWYKRNVHLIMLALRVEMDNLKKRALSKYFQL